MNKNIRQIGVVGFISLFLVFAYAACTSGPSGTYSDANGAVLLELKSGGKANIHLHGRGCGLHGQHERQSAYAGLQTAGGQDRLHDSRRRLVDWAAGRLYAHVAQAEVSLS